MARLERRIKDLERTLAAHERALVAALEAANARLTKIPDVERELRRSRLSVVKGGDAS